MEEYDLTLSAQKMGKLYPILKDKQGNIIDGFHRRNADPDWPSLTLDSVDTEVKLELARLAANFCRRNIPFSEMQKRIGFLLKSGLKAEEISEQTGISKTTIYRYMPQDLKGPASQAISNALQTKSQISRNEVSPDTSSSKTSDMVECERCHVATSTAKQWHGHILCEKCEARAQLNPEFYDGWFRIRDREHAKIADKTLKEPDRQTVEDSWEHRKAQMTPQHSKIEGMVIQDLINKGIKNIVQDRRFCIMETCPDIFFPAHNLAVYLDNEETHKNKSDRDDQLRELLVKRHQIRVLTLPYDSPSQKETDRLVEQILGEIDPQNVSVKEV